MKKLFTSLALIAGCTFGAYAQHCAAVSNNVTPVLSNTAGLKPVSDSLNCLVPNTYVSDTIYFTNYSSAGTLGNIDYLKIDSLENLPAGLCWTTNKTDNKFNGGESGVILVQGTTTAAPGQYKLRIVIDIKVGLISLTNQDAETLTQTALGSALRYYVRVKSASNCCFKVDTTAGKTNYFIPEASITTGCTTLGVADVSNEISGLSVQPNPFASSATIRFSAENESSYSVKMMNLLGATVMTKEIKSVRGGNEITIDRNNLNAGIYLISVSNGKSSITKKVIIE
jgi:hypothetical protein